MPQNERERFQDPGAHARDTDPGVHPPPPPPITRMRYFHIASTIAAFAAFVAGLLGKTDPMLWLAYASIALNVLSFWYDGCWVMDTEPGVHPPPPPPLPAMRTFQALALLAMLAGAVAGSRGQAETLLVLAVVSFAANALSLWMEGSRNRPPIRGAQR